MKIPGLDYPITIENNSKRVKVTFNCSPTGRGCWEWNILFTASLERPNNGTKYFVHTN